MLTECRFFRSLGLKLMLTVGLVLSTCKTVWSAPDGSGQVIAPKGVMNDPTQGLSLVELYRSALVQNPSIRSAVFDARAAGQDVQAIERQRWPTLSVVTESNTGNVRNTPSSSLQVEQVIWDFGLLSARIANTQNLADASLVKVQLQQQDVMLQIIGAWQFLWSARERERVALKTLDRMRDYRLQMQRRVSEQASPPIDLELVDARLLQTQVELDTAQNTAKVAIQQLERHTGLRGLTARVEGVSGLPGSEHVDAFGQYLKSADLKDAALKSALVAKARLDSARAKQEYEAVSAQNLPTIYARSVQPLVKTMNGVDYSTTMSTFIGLRYSPGAGFSTALQAQAMATRISSAQELVEHAALDIEQVMRSDKEEFASQSARIKSLEQSVKGSENVLVSYKRQFEANRKSWLDLMNAVRELTQNEYALAEARSAQVSAMHRLQVRLGLNPL
jgi:outer membrane protein, adhesin transport system